MANEIDRELYPDNNSHTTARPERWRLNPTTGAEEQVPATGLEDLEAYLALTRLAETSDDAIHADLVETMVEVLDTAAYEATFSGAAKRAQIELADKTDIYVHWQSVSAGYHEYAKVKWRTSRVA